MKLTKALSAAALILAPGASLAMEPQNATNQYPYPDWPAVAKTAPLSSKAAEEKAPGNKGEAGILEKAGQAVESITGGSAGMKQSPSQEGAAQNVTRENKGEPGFLEKAKEAIESVTGGTAGIKEKARQAVESITGGSAGTKEEGTSQLKPAESKQEAQAPKGEAQYPYPDWPAVAKTGPDRTNKP
jgi:hypothetical protein